MTNLYSVSFILNGEDYREFIDAQSEEQALARACDLVLGTDVPWVLSDLEIEQV